MTVARGVHHRIHRRLCRTNPEIWRSFPARPRDQPSLQLLSFPSPYPSPLPSPARLAEWTAGGGTRGVQSSPVQLISPVKTAFISTCSPRVNARRRHPTIGGMSGQVRNRARRRWATRVIGWTMSPNDDPPTGGRGFLAGRACLRLRYYCTQMDRKAMTGGRGRVTTGVREGLASWRFKHGKYT